ncbi:hypothetical protein sos41_21540 [Alphaproteobacteria bacterium SO-S41]|nr:hypothetical protein sos41_21540 [Alphaproteobacteria bacterium SO-S41]
MFENLALSSVLIIFCVAVHFFGLTILAHILRGRAGHLRPRNTLPGQGLVIVVIVLGLFFIHSVEIWAYALVYHAIGAMPDFEAALYFSTVTFTTVGYGDVTLGTDWRMFGAIEAAAGMLLFGWSAAFLIAAMGNLRSFEHGTPRKPD